MGRARRAGNTVTLSVSLSPADAAVVRRRAKRVHGGNVSAAMSDAAALLRLEENREALAAKLEEELGPLDPRLARAILMESAGAVPPVRRRKRRSAT